MAQFIKNYVQDLAQDIQIRHCGTLIFNTDSDSNVINVSLYNGQEEAPQSGSVACAVICSDGSTVPVTGGTISGNTVSVTLGADGLIPGQVGIGIQVISGDVKTTVFKAVYSVELFETDTVVDPSSRITISVGELVSDIEAAVASIPADYSDLLAAITPTFSTSTAYASGSYVWYSGHLYRFTAAHSAGAWVGTDAVQVALADDVSDLKSALDNFKEDCGYAPIPLQMGKSIVNNTSSAVIIPSNITNENGFCCLCIPCQKGDIYSITGTGGSSTRLWAFSDADGVRIDGSLGNASATDLVLTAPEGTAYFSFNSKTTNGIVYSVYAGVKPVHTFEEIDNQFGEMGTRIDNLEDFYDEAQITVNVPASDITIHDNYYMNSSGSEVGPYSSWQYGEYTIPSNAKTLIVTGEAGQAAKLWVLKNESGTVLAYSDYSDTPMVLSETINLSLYPTAKKVFISDKKSGFLAISYKHNIQTIDGEKVYINGESLPSIINENDKLFGKILCCVGDSITYGADMDSDGITNESNITVYNCDSRGNFTETTSNFRKTWGWQIASRHGMVFYNGGVSGSTMQGMGQSGFSNENGRYTKLPDNLDYLLIWFGWNDNAYGTLGEITDVTNESYYGGYNVVLPYLINKYPYAKIGLIVPYGASAGHREAVRLLGNKWGVAVWDNYQGGTPLYFGKEDSVGVDANIVTANRAKYQALGAHPNFKGHTQLADMIEEWMKGI